MFKFYLKINEILHQISEPYGFDGANFSIEQDKKRFGRDVSYMSEKTQLTFYNNTYEYDPVSDTYLTHGFEELLNQYKEKGFESEVLFIIEKDGLTFTTGELEFKTVDTDEYSYFAFSVITETLKAIVKRREDVECDLFSTKNMDNEDITAAQTSKIFLKAKPVVQVSEWSGKTMPFAQYSGQGFGAGLWCPVVNNLTKFSIENSFAPFDINYTLFEPTGQEIKDQLIDNRLLTAFNDLSNVKILIKNVNTSGQMSFFVTFTLNMVIYDGSGNVVQNEILHTEFGYGFSIVNQSYEIDVPFIASGSHVVITANLYYSSGTFLNFDMYFDSFTCDGVGITATSTAISSVIKGVRYIDMIKQNLKSINNMTVNAIDFDATGDHYNNFVFNGKLIRQFDNETFYIKFKEIAEQLQELNHDYQINDNILYIGKYQDFYSNNEIGAFLQAPNIDFKVETNDRYLINQVEYKYKSYEQDRDEAGTIDAVHTEAQWLLPNKKVENNLKIDIPFVRDVFEIESARKQNFYTKDTTSLSNDDKVYIIDCIQIAPNTRESFTRNLRWQSIISTNKVKIVSDGTFSFSLLGFSVGDNITININNEGNVNYIVSSIETSVVSLTPVIGSISFDESGLNSIFIDYPLTGVEYINRTNQEFQNIENVYNSDNFGNLQYTIRQNLQHWESYLKTACKYSSGQITNSYFKANGNLITEFRNGGNIQEKAPINIIDLQDAFITPKLYNTVLVAGFDEVLTIIEKMQVINPDNSIGGFVRCSDHNGKVLKLYPTKLEYTWLTGELKITGEEREEGANVVINTIGVGLIEVNRVGYDENILKPIEIKTKGDYLQIVDYRGVAITNYTLYSNYLVNSEKFSNIVALLDALLSL